MSSSKLMSLLLLSLLAWWSPLVHAGEGSRERSDTVPPRGATTYPWRLNTEHRFLWLHKREKVGETRFLVKTAPFPGKPKKRLYAVSATRSYQREGVVQQATGTTHVSPSGEPHHYEENLTVLHATSANRSRQFMKFERRGRIGRVTYVQNGRQDRPVVREQVLPDGTFLCANQAVEHWVLFVAALPNDFERRDVKLFYPDHRKVLEVELRRKAEETIMLGKKPVAARRYTFRSRKNELNGNLWIGPDRRLLQIEFPSTQLKVVLTSE